MMLLNTLSESCLSAFQVLNVGHAKLMGKAKVGAMTSLGALILNDNALTSISGKTCTALQSHDLALMRKLHTCAHRPARLLLLVCCQKKEQRCSSQVLEVFLYLQA